MQDPSVGMYDIILLDLDMPIMDGFTACLKIIQYIKLVNEEDNYKNEKI
jgi:CheY-like chemotaxis protein